MSDSSVVWSSIPAEQIRIRSWDDEDGLVAVYDTRTGDTHLVEDVAITLLAMIRQSPLGVEALADQLAGYFHATDHEAIQKFVGATLLQLRDLGLVTETTR